MFEFLFHTGINKWASPIRDFKAGLFREFLFWAGPFPEFFISSVRSSNSHPDLLVIQHQPLFQITTVLNTGLSLSEPIELYKGHKAI